MSDMDFTISGLSELTESLQKAVKAYPDKAEKTLKASGNKFKKRVCQITDEAEIKEHTGNLKKGYKVSKVHGYGTDMEIDFHGETKTNPHFHLIENGHEQISKDGNHIGFVPGYHIVAQARTEYKNVLPKELDKMCKKILKESNL